MSLTLDDIKARPRHEVDFTLECSGNHGGAPFATGFLGNARWAGTPLAPLLRKPVFKGGDRSRLLRHRSRNDHHPRQHRNRQRRENRNRRARFRRRSRLQITERFARSMSLEDALDPRNLLCYEMNGVPLPTEHGFPVR